MAAAIIPLVASLAPSLIGLIAGLVHKAAPIAEAQGAGTGQVKFAEVLAAVMGSLTAATEAGQIKMPDSETVKIVIQAVVSSMKLSGLLDGVVPLAVKGTVPALVLKAGQSVTISVQ